MVGTFVCFGRGKAYLKGDIEGTLEQYFSGGKF